MLYLFQLVHWHIIPTLLLLLDYGCSILNGYMLQINYYFNSFLMITFLLIVWINTGYFKDSMSDKRIKS